jgi:hypothetical protein
MTGEPGGKGTPHPPTDERAQGQDVLGLGEWERDFLLAWVGENLTLCGGRLPRSGSFTGSLGSGFGQQLDLGDGKLLVKHTKLRTAFTTKFGSVVA